MARSILLCCVLLAGFLLTAAPSQAQAPQPALSGTVTDASSGQSLAFANVILTQEGRSGILGGAATNADGLYVIPRLQPGAYLITIRFVGYGEVQLPVEIVAGVPQVLDAELTQGGLDLNTIVITASRQAEKVLEAPASISVLDAREIEGDVVPSSVGVLRNLTGVDMAQTGVDRTEMVLRGFNNAFSGSAYILTDYRHSAVASLNVNAHNVMPNMLIDLERIEVVRGPGSALYGAGVDQGVVHYITKDPFNYPGTTLSVMGGEQSLVGGQLRHAGTIGENVGYKVTGFYSQASEWAMDATTVDSLILNTDVVPRNNDFNKLNVNGTLKLRLGPRASITANGGYSELQSVLLSGIGTLQAKGFGYSYGQLRLQADRFFAQIYMNINNAGESFSYGLGVPVVDNGRQLTAQAQYDWSLAEDRVQVVLGADLELTRPDTQGLILGRNETMDDINEIGGYTQATIELSRKIDITMAFRGDWSNIYDELQLSPRAALVYKVAPGHTLRGSYNRSFSSPGVNSLFLDIISQQTLFTPDPMGPRLLFMARGSVNATTFEQFRMNNSAAMFLPVDGFYGNQFDVGNMPLVPIYGSAAAGGLIDFLTSQAPIPIPGVSLTDQQRGLLAGLLGYTAATGALLGSNTTATALGIPDSEAAGGFIPVAGPIDIEPLKQTVSQTIEFGYKGLLTEKILFGFDAYLANKKDFTGPLLVESPLVYLQGQGLGQDVGLALGTLFATTTDPNILTALGDLGATALTPTEVATILATLVAGSFDNQPVAVVQPDQQVLNAADANQQNAVGGFLGYRNFGDVDFWGIDTSLQILASESLTLFANASFIQGDFFQIEDLTNPNAPRRPALNAPAFKAKAGGSFRLPGGLSFSVSGRFVEGFPVRSGPFTGSVDSYTLLDAGLGYDFGNGSNGLRIDFSVQNVLDSMNRQFVGAPQIGRLALARLTYTGGAR